MAKLRSAVFLTICVKVCFVVRGSSNVSDDGAFPVASKSMLRAKAWNNDGYAYHWPEESILPTKQSEGYGALLFSGGGLRAFSCAIGQLRALTLSGNIRRYQYMGGISGGSWATGLYCYGEPRTYGEDDSVFLGPSQAAAVGNLSMAVLGPVAASSAVACPSVHAHAEPHFSQAMF